MADIELVIRISEEEYESCKKEFKNLGENELIGEYEYAIANGTPLPKTGHWIRQSRIHEFRNYYKCSACGKGDTYLTFNFCPNCGAKMVESEE